MNIKFFLSIEKPSIVQFDSGHYGIRKKRSLSSEYSYLDLDDIRSSMREERNLSVNWRSESDLLKNRGSITWVQREKFRIVYDIFDALKNPNKHKEKIKSNALSQEEIEKNAFVSKLSETE